MKEKSPIRNILIACLYLGIWQVLYLLIRQEILIVSPLSVFIKMLELLKETSFYSSIIHSFLRILVGFLSALTLGTLLGWITYRSKLALSILSPALTIIKTTPVASFIILALVWLPSNSLTMFISFLMVLPLIWKNIYQGLANTDIKLLEMAKTFNFSQLTTLKNIYIPQVTPYFYAAVTTGLGFAWKSGIAAEVIGTPKASIGTNLYNAKIYIETTDLFAWTIVVIILSIIMEKIIILLMNKWLYRGNNHD